MNVRRAASIVLAAVAVASLATGTLGFTSVSADRGVQVNVVEPENGYVGVQACRTSNGQGSGNGNGAMPAKVYVKNQFSAPFTVTSINWSDSAHSSNDGLQVDEQLEPGNATVYNNAFGDDVVTVTVTGGLEATVNVPVEQSGNCTAFT